jgi:hypothetical protein
VSEKQSIMRFQPRPDYEKVIFEMPFVFLLVYAWIADHSGRAV